MTRLTTLLFLYPCITASHWRSPVCRSKHVGEHFVNKIHHKMNAHLLLIYIYIYIYILDLINVRMVTVKQSHYMPGHSQRVLGS